VTQLQLYFHQPSEAESGQLYCVMEGRVGRQLMKT